MVQFVHCDQQGAALVLPHEQRGGPGGEHNYFANSGRPSASETPVK